MNLGLRVKLFLLLTMLVFFVAVGQGLLRLSSDLGYIYENTYLRGGIVAQGVASSCAQALDSAPPSRADLEAVVRRVAASLDLLSLAVTDRDGRVMAHTDPVQVGRVLDVSGFSSVAARPDINPWKLFGDEPTIFTTSAPVLGGLSVLGYVQISFRSDDVPKALREMAVFALLTIVVWMLLGMGLAGVIVRHVTNPLRELTEAVANAGRGRFVYEPRGERSDEIGLLQHSFSTLTASLAEKRGENARLVGELRDLNANLQQRVDEVTADLVSARNYLSSVLRCLDEGILACDGAGGIQMANRGAETLLAACGVEQMPRDIFSALPGAAEVRERFTKVASGRSRGESLAIKMSGADNGTRHLRLTLLPHTRDAAHSAGVVCVIADETERSRFEEQIRRSDRLASLGTLSAGLAHELGNYLNVVLGYSSLLLRQVVEELPARRDIQRIHDESKKAAEMLERFLLFARPHRAEFGVHDLRDVAHGVLDMLAYKVRKQNITAHEACPKEPVLVECDTRLLDQAVLNVALNAVQAMPDGGTLTLAVRCLPDSVSLSVADTGRGIDPSVIERIFDPFFTTKGEGEGTGLGLSIVQRIVDIHHGRVEVRSEPGKGSVFTIVLPRVNQ